MVSCAGPREYVPHVQGDNWLSQIERFGFRGVTFQRPKRVNGVCPVRDMVTAALGSSGRINFVEDEENDQLVVYFLSHEQDTDPDPTDDPDVAIAKSAMRILGDYKRRACRLPSGAMLMPAA